MAEFLDFLQLHSGGLTVLFTAVVAIATIVYAFLTARLVAETRALRRLESEPSISIYISPSPKSIHLLMITIENMSRAPILDLTFSVEPTMEDLATANVELDFLKALDGLQYLGPGQTITSFYGSALEILRNGPAQVVKVVATFKGATGRRFSQKFALDPDRFRGLQSIGSPPDEEVAKALKGIAKDLGAIRSGQLRVLAKIEGK